MNLIYQIYQKLFSVFNKKKSVEENNQNTEEPKYLGGIFFKITEDLEIDIGCVLPDVQGLSTDEISNISEKYAELLIMINSGIFRSQMFDMIKNKTKLIEEEDIKERLFIDNLLSFDKILTHELNKAAKNNKPLIRPVSVFKNS
jgi:hypothetical protein